MAISPLPLFKKHWIQGIWKTNFQSGNVLSKSLHTKTPNSFHQLPRPIVPTNNSNFYLLKSVEFVSLVARTSEKQIEMDKQQFYWAANNAGIRWRSFLRWTGINESWAKVKGELITGDPVFLRCQLRWQISVEFHCVSLMCYLCRLLKTSLVH